MACLLLKFVVGPVPRRFPRFYTLYFKLSEQLFRDGSLTKMRAGCGGNTTTQVQWNDRRDDRHVRCNGGPAAQGEGKIPANVLYCCLSNYFMQA
jgi:hypothetical protein